MKRFARILQILLIAVLYFTSFSTHANALTTKTMAVSRGVNIYINDIPFTPTDAAGKVVEAFVYQGTTYLPARAISEMFGAQISWDEKQETVAVTYNKAALQSPCASDHTSTPLRQSVVTAYSGVHIVVNEKEFVPTDANGRQVSVFSIGGTTYLPARAFTALFGEKIFWEGANSGVYIGSHNPLMVKSLPTNAEWESRYLSAARQAGIEGTGMLEDFDVDGIPEYLCIISGAGMSLQYGVLDCSGEKIAWCDGNGGYFPLQQYERAGILSLETPTDLHRAKNTDTGEVIWYATASTGNDIEYRESVLLFSQGNDFLKINILFEEVTTHYETGNKITEKVSYKYQGQSVDAKTYITQKAEYFSHLTEM